MVLKKWKKRSDVTDSVWSSCVEAWLAFAERKIQQENRGFLEGGWEGRVGEGNKVLDFIRFLKILYFESGGEIH